MYKRPPFIRTGDTVGFIAPAGKITSLDLQPALDVFRQWELNVQLGNNLFETHYQFAATDEQRRSDLQAMLDNPDIAAIICARGGYGITRIIDTVDFSRFLEQPKWIAGYSDITVLHAHLHRRGVQTIHSIMPLTFGQAGTEASVESLRKVLFGETVRYETPAHPMNHLGTANGAIIGGNVSLLATIIGTASDIDTAGKILFIEDIGEYYYHLDRMMVHLKRAGKLTDLTGLIVGDFSEMKQNKTPFGKTAYEIIADAVQGYHYPVSYGFPVGHEPHNLAIPCGSRATLSVSAAGTKLTFGEEKIR